MPKIKYKDKKFTGAHLKVIDQANKILIDYAKQGYDLTLRQLYYQFVSKDLIVNDQKQYKRLGEIISSARLAGLIDWDHIVDRTRNLRGLPHWGSPEEIIQGAAGQFRIDKWEDQPYYIEVWVEKDALIGLLEVACKPLFVNFFSCRGYTSQSEMWGAAMRLQRKIEQGKQVRILHFGDHDPSGMDMTRDIEKRIAEDFLPQSCGRVDFFNLQRVALNMDQIQEYKPPPNPAKESDSRSDDYIKKFGNESWELDALTPQVITGLIKQNVLMVRDEEKWAEALRAEQLLRDQLDACVDNWAGVTKFLKVGARGPEPEWR